MNTTQTERQALDAAINRTTRRKTRKESTALPYPELPDADQSHALFWLAAWLRQQKEIEELEAHIARKDWRSYSEPLRFIFSRSQSTARDEAKMIFDDLVRHGGLLFAWHGTTALAGFEVLQ